MRYVSIDVETTGLDTERCSILELAMVFEDTSKPNTPVEELLIFHGYMQQERPYWEPFAKRMHKESGLLKEVREKGWPASMFWREVYEALRSGMPWTVAGKNVAGFDLQFFPSHIRDLFSHRVIDPGSVFWGEMPIRSLSELKRDFGLPEAVSHRALDDARDVIRVLRCVNPKYRNKPW